MTHKLYVSLLYTNKIWYRLLYQQYVISESLKSLTGSKPNNLHTYTLYIHLHAEVSFKT